MSFTDQKPRVATAADVTAKWGSQFRCYLCGHRFQVGDQWRWVWSGAAALRNCLVCARCDGDDVLERWQALNDELAQRFWWVLGDLKRAQA